MALVRDSKTGKFDIDDVELSTIATNMDKPPYRRAFTKIQSSSIAVINKDGSFDTNPLLIDMPYVSMVFNENNNIYKKYLDPLEFNIYV